MAGRSAIHICGTASPPNIGRQLSGQAVDDEHECLVGTCHDAAIVARSLLLGGVTLVQGRQSESQSGKGEGRDGGSGAL